MLRKPLPVRPAGLCLPERERGATAWASVLPTLKRFRGWTRPCSGRRRGPFFSPGPLPNPHQ